MRKIFLLPIIYFSAFVNAQNYIPDPSFGGTGSVVTNYNMYYDNDQAPKNVFYQNNKYIFTQKTQLSSFNYDGTVDYTFGNLGFTRIIIPNCTITIKNTKIINSTIFVFGKAHDPNTGLFYGFIAKMSIDGILDSTFGNNGIVTVTIGQINNDAYSDGITDVVFKNGNYFGVGSVFYQDTNAIVRRNIFTVKLNPDGIIDLTNDPTGIKKITSLDGHQAVNLYEYQGDLLIVGHITDNNTGNENSLTISKINENGDLVSTFGVNGVKKIALSPLGIQTGENFSNCKLQGDDIYILRTYFLYTNVVQKIQKVNIGNLSTTDISVTNSNSTVRYEIDDNKIYIIGCLSNCSNDFNIIRRNIDGTLDNSFNQTGTYTYSFPSPNGVTATYDSATVLVRDTNNRILIGGYTAAQSYTTAPYQGFAMLRIIDETLAINEVKTGNLSLSPNPVKSVLNIEKPDRFKLDNITIFDVSGKMVYYANNPPLNINLENLKQGLYFVKISDGNSGKSFKIIKSN